MKLYTLLMALSTFTATTAMADGLVHLSHRFGLGVDGGVAIPTLFSNFTNATGTGYSVGGHFNYNFTDGLDVEAQYEHLVYKTGNPITNGYTLGFDWRLVPSGAISPVLGIAGGWGWSTGVGTLDNSYNNFMAIAKAGFDFRLSDEWFFNAALKYDWLFSKVSGSKDQQTLNPVVGFTYYPGHSEDKAMTDKETIEKERQHERDLQAQADAANARANSSDAAAAAAAAAAANGQKDDDGDGVPNSVDKCPNTPPGSKVNSIGCTVEDKVNMTIDIQFKTGKSTFATSYNSEIDKMVDLLKQHDDVTAEIQGYTDNVGSAAKNKSLSNQRAHSVQKYIVMHGVPASRVTYKGYGEENPVADNTSADGRAQNRRVVAAISSRKSAGGSTSATPKASSTANE